MAKSKAEAADIAASQRALRDEANREVAAMKNRRNFNSNQWNKVSLNGSSFPHKIDLFRLDALEEVVRKCKAEAKAASDENMRLEKEHSSIFGQIRHAETALEELRRNRWAESKDFDSAKNTVSELEDRLAVTERAISANNAVNASTSEKFSAASELLQKCRKFVENEL